MALFSSASALALTARLAAMLDRSSSSRCFFSSSVSGFTWRGREAKGGQRRPSALRTTRASRRARTSSVDSENAWWPLFSAWKLASAVFLKILLHCGRSARGKGRQCLLDRMTSSGLAVECADARAPGPYLVALDRLLVCAHA